MTPKNNDHVADLALKMGIFTQLHSSRLHQLLAEFELNVSQFGILNHLARHQNAPQRITEIARAVEVNQPAVTKTIARFENAAAWY
jgi:DNA-binding MarR family transcriptional regulator